MGRRRDLWYPIASRVFFPFPVATKYNVNNKIIEEKILPWSSSPAKKKLHPATGRGSGADWGKTVGEWGFGAKRRGRSKEKGKGRGGRRCGDFTIAILRCRFETGV